MFRVVSTFLLIAATRAAITPQPTQAYPHTVVLEEQGNVHLFWDYNQENITFELHTRTRGWAALGISPNGGMFGSDIALGWIDDVTGQAQLHDAFVSSPYNSLPDRDATQNLQLLAHRQCADVTVLKFSRRLRSCDSANDKDITDGTIRLIYAFGSTDPATYNDVRYHGRNRGTKAVRLLGPAVAPPPLAGDERSIKLLNPNVKMPSAKTTYWCQAFQFPKLTSKHHMVQINPIIQKGNEGIVHHILLYRCFHKVSASLHGYGRECYTGPMPDNLHECFNVWASWAIGGGDFLFPDHVGYPVGPADGPDFLLMETHFDNPRQLSGILDNSGLELVITQKIRKYDAGIVQAGSLVEPTQVIPPFFPGYVNRNYCPSECLSKAMPSSIHMFAGLLHSHLLGRKIYARLIRNGTEVASLGYDNNYDFNLQETRLFKKEVEVKPTDDIVVDCVYDSSARTGLTLGGLSTVEEMCMGFLYYYPTRRLSDCSSAIIPAHFLNLAGATKWTSNFVITEPARLAGKHFIEALRQLDWSNETLRDTFQEMTNSDQSYRYYRCNVDGKNLLNQQGGKKPYYTEHAEPAVPVCTARLPFQSRSLTCPAPPLITSPKQSFTASTRAITKPSAGTAAPGKGGPSLMDKLRFPIVG